MGVVRYRYRLINCGEHCLFILSFIAQFNFYCFCMLEKYLPSCVLLDSGCLDPIILPNLTHNWYIGCLGSHTPGTRPIFIPIGGHCNRMIRILRKLLIIRIQHCRQKLAHDWYIGCLGSHTPGTRPISLPIGGHFSHQLLIRHIAYTNPDPGMPLKSWPTIGI